MSAEGKAGEFICDLGNIFIDKDKFTLDKIIRFDTSILLNDDYLVKVILSATNLDEINISEPIRNRIDWKSVNDPEHFLGVLNQHNEMPKITRQLLKNPCIGIGSDASDIEEIFPIEFLKINSRKPPMTHLIMNEIIYTPVDFRRFKEVVNKPENLNKNIYFKYDGAKSMRIAFNGQHSINERSLNNIGNYEVLIEANNNAYARTDNIFTKGIAFSIGKDGSSLYIYDSESY